MNRFIMNGESQDVLPVQKVCFTANSIHFLATTHLPVNLDEWEWHEEIVDGIRTFVITDKKISPENYSSTLIN